MKIVIYFFYENHSIWFTFDGCFHFHMILANESVADVDNFQHKCMGKWCELDGFIVSLLSPLIPTHIYFCVLRFCSCRMHKKKWQEDPARIIACGPFITCPAHSHTAIHKIAYLFAQWLHRGNILHTVVLKLKGHYLCC